MCFSDDSNRVPYYQPSPPARPVYGDEIQNISNSSLSPPLRGPTRPVYGDEINHISDPTAETPARKPVGSPGAYKQQTAKPKDPSTPTDKPKKETAIADANKALNTQFPSSPIPLTAPNIKHALSYVNTYLQERRQRFVIVAMGEVVKALQLGPNVVAKNLNFFRAHLNEVQAKAVKNAMEHSEKMTGIPLGKGWMRPDFIEHAGLEKHKFLTKLADKAASVHNNGLNPLFKAEFLEVHAVPLSYTFMMYVSRLDTMSEKPTDFRRAIDYLHAVSASRRGRLIDESRIAVWCGEYKVTVRSRQVLQRLNARYDDLHHRTGIEL